MDILTQIRLKASQNPRKIVLPESDDPRTIEAVDYILEYSVAKLVVIGKEDFVSKLKTKNIKDLEVIDPERYKETEKFASSYYELRKAKGITIDEARDAMKKDCVTFGAMLVRSGYADGFVAGANHTTPDIIRAALRCISIDKTIGVVSGAFLMEFPITTFGENGVFIFADCGVNPEPNTRQLAGIAVASAGLFEKLVGKPARVALLSYSTKGSASGEQVDRIVEATKKAKEMAPGLIIDGELQSDSAIVPEVAGLKCPGSPVEGKANVLIFPDLNSGNICYKLAQRLGNARAVGPLFQGFLKPCSDLSRGCSWQDIVDAVATTSVRV